MPAAGGEVRKSPRYFLSGRRRRRRQTLDSGPFSERFVKSKTSRGGEERGCHIKAGNDLPVFPVAASPQHERDELSSISASRSSEAPQALKDDKNTLKSRFFFLPKAQKQTKKKKKNPNTPQIVTLFTCASG